MTADGPVLLVEGTRIAWEPELGVWRPLDTPSAEQPPAAAYAVVWLDQLFGVTWVTGPWDPDPDRRRATEALAFLESKGLQGSVVFIPDDDDADRTPGRVYGGR